MASPALSADEFAKLVNQIVRSHCKRTRVTKPGACRYLWEDGEHNALAEILVRPTANDVLVRFISSRRQRACRRNRRLAALVLSACSAPPVSSGLDPSLRLSRATVGVNRGDTPDGASRAVYDSRYLPATERTTVSLG